MLWLPSGIDDGDRGGSDLLRYKKRQRKGFPANDEEETPIENGCISGESLNATENVESEDGTAYISMGLVENKGRQHIWEAVDPTDCMVAGDRMDKDISLGRYTLSTKSIGDEKKAEVVGPIIEDQCINQCKLTYKRGDTGDRGQGAS